jgi:hypothetical protein
VVRGLETELTEDERYAVADHVAAQLKERGNPWQLNDEAQVAKAPSTQFASGRAIPPPDPAPRSSDRSPGLKRPGLL